MILAIILFILGVIEVRYSPRLEKTRNRDLLLMYTTIKNKRNYLKLGKI